MEETVAVKEMFDGLYNIIVGPGFYTVNGAKKKRTKVSKSSLQSMGSHEDLMTSVSDQESSKEEKEYRPSTESVGDFAYKSIAGSDSDIICDDNASSIVGPNTVFVSHEPSIDIPRTEGTVSSEHKHNNVCDTVVLLPGKQATDDKIVCASLKSKSYVTKEQECASKFGYSKQPTDLTRSSRGNGSKNSTMSVVRVDRSDVTSKQSRTLQGEGTSNVPGVSHKATKCDVTSKHSRPLQGEGTSNVPGVSHKATKCDVTSKHSRPLQGEGTSNVPGVSHKANKCDVTSKHSRPLQGEGASNVPGVSHKANKCDETSKQSRPLQGEGTSNVPGVSHKATKCDVTSKHSRPLQGEGTSNVPGVSHKATKCDVTSKQSRPLQGEESTHVSGISHVSLVTYRSDVTSKKSWSPQGEGPSSVSHVSHKASISDATSKQPRSLQAEGPSTVPDVSHVSHKTNLEGADLTISSRRSSGRPQLSPDKTVKRRIQPSLSNRAVKLHQEHKTTASILTSDDGSSITINDLTISSRRSFGRPSESKLLPEKSVRRRRQSADEETPLSVGAVTLQEEQKPAASILKSDDGRPVTILGSVPCSSKDVDARSDISTDSHASGYAPSRPAVLPQPSSEGRPSDGHRKLRKKPAPGHPHSRLSSSPVKKSAEKSETKISPVKRKWDGDSSETLRCKKVKSNQGSREKSSKSKMITDNKKKQTPTRKKVRTKTRSNGRDNKTKQLKHNTTATVNYQRLLSLRGLINLKKPKHYSNQSPAKCPSRSSGGHSGGHRQLRSSTKKMSAEHISLAANKSSPRKLSLRGMQKPQHSKHKQNRHRSSTKQKVQARNNERSDSKHRSKQVLRVKQGSDIDKHRRKSKRRRRRRSADSLSVQEALAKQQQVIAEHSKETDKFEDGNIISALCQLEDRAKTLQSHDLDLLMPMSDLSTNRNAVLGVRGEGHNNHPGGVWKKLIPEN